MGIFFAELDPVVALLKSSLPQLPVAVIEAYTAIAAFTVPSGVDWLGMDRYGSPNVMLDEEWKADYRAIKAKRSATHQKMFIVMDSQWLPIYGDAGYPQEAMAEVNRHYLEFAQSDSDIIGIIGIIGYIWAGGLDSPEHRGVRDLPQVVRDENIRIGKTITGK